MLSGVIRGWFEEQAVGHDLEGHNSLVSNYTLQRRV